MEGKERSYYNILEVSESASTDEIKRAFKRLARKHHPDAGGDEAKMKEISEAYDTLSDSEKREQYDTYLKYGAFAGGGERRGYHPWAGAGGSQSGWRAGTNYSDAGSWNDIFSRIAHGEGAFGTEWEFPNRKTKGADVQVTLEVTFEEAFSGITKRITVRSAGDKASSAASETQQLEVKVPAGATEGGKLRYKGRGNKGSDGGVPGDLVVVLKIKPHRLYSRKGSDVLMDLPLALDEAALGITITIPAPNGDKMRLKVPPGTEDSKVFLLKGKGAPKLKGGGFGDLRVKTHIILPKTMSDEEREALQAFAQARKNRQEMQADSEALRPF